MVGWFAKALRRMSAEDALFWRRRVLGRVVPPVTASREELWRLEPAHQVYLDALAFIASQDRYQQVHAQVGQFVPVWIADPEGVEALVPAVERESRDAAQRDLAALFGNAIDNAPAEGSAAVPVHPGGSGAWLWQFAVVRDSLDRHPQEAAVWRARAAELLTARPLAEANPAAGLSAQLYAGLVDRIAEAGRLSGEAAAEEMLARLWVDVVAAGADWYLEGNPEPRVVGWLASALRALPVAEQERWRHEVVDWVRPPEVASAEELVRLAPAHQAYLDALAFLASQEGSGESSLVRRFAPARIEDPEEAAASVPDVAPESRDAAQQALDALFAEAVASRQAGSPGDADLVAMNDLLVDDIRVSDVDWVPLGSGGGSFGMAFPLDGDEEKVMRRYVPDPGEDRYSVVMHRGEAGYRVKAKGRVVVLDNAALGKLFAGLGVLAAPGAQAGVVLVTCPQWARPEIGVLESKVRELGYRGPVGLRGAGPRAELLPDGRVRDLAEDETPTPGGVVLGDRARGSRTRKARGSVRSGDNGGEGSSRTGAGSKRDAGAVGRSAAGAHKRTRSGVVAGPEGGGAGTAEPASTSRGAAEPAAAEASAIEFRQVWRADAKPGKAGPDTVAGDAVLAAAIDALAVRLIESDRDGLASPPVRAAFHGKASSLTGGIHEAWQEFFAGRIDAALAAKGSALTVAGLGLVVDLVRRASENVQSTWVELLVDDNPGEPIDRLRAASSVVMELDPESRVQRVWSSSWARLVRAVEGAGYEALAVLAAGGDPRLGEVSAVVARSNGLKAEGKARLEGRLRAKVRWGLERVLAAAQEGRGLPGGLSADRLPTVDEMMPSVRFSVRTTKKARAADKAVLDERVTVALSRSDPPAEADPDAEARALEEFFAGMAGMSLLDSSPAAQGPPSDQGPSADRTGAGSGLWEGEVKYQAVRVADTAIAGLRTAAGRIADLVVDARRKGLEAPVVRAVFHGPATQLHHSIPADWRTVLTELVDQALAERSPGLSAAAAGLVIELAKAEGKDHPGPARLVLEAETGPAKPVAGLRVASPVMLEVLSSTSMEVRGLSLGRVFWRSEGAGAEILEAFAAGDAEEARMPALTVTVIRNYDLTDKKRAALIALAGAQVRMGAARALAAARARAERDPSWLSADRLPSLDDFVPEIETKFVHHRSKAEMHAEFAEVPGSSDAALAADRERAVEAFFGAARDAGLTDAALAEAGAIAGRSDTEPAKAVLKSFPSEESAAVARDAVAIAAHAAAMAEPAVAWQEVWRATAQPIKAGMKSVADNEELAAAIDAVADELIEREQQKQELPLVSVVCYAANRVLLNADLRWRGWVEGMIDAALVRKGHPRLSVAGLGLWVDLRRVPQDDGPSQMALEVGEAPRELLAARRTTPSVPLGRAPGKQLRTSAFAWVRLLRRGEGAAVEGLAALSESGDARMSPVKVTITRGEPFPAAREAEVEAHFRNEVLRQMRWSAERVLSAARVKAARGDLGPDRSASWLPSVDDMVPEVHIQFEVVPGVGRTGVLADIPVRAGTPAGVVEGFFAGLAPKDLLGGRRPGLPKVVRRGLPGTKAAGLDPAADRLAGEFEVRYREDGGPWLSEDTVARVRAFAVRWAARMKEFALQEKEFPQTRLHVDQRGGTAADGARLFAEVEGILLDEAGRLLGAIRAGLGRPAVKLADLGLGITRGWRQSRRTSETNIDNDVEAASFRIATFAASGLTHAELAELRETPLYTGYGAGIRSELTPFELFRVRRMASGFARRLYRDGQMDRLVLEQKAGAAANWATSRRRIAVLRVVEEEVREAYREFGRRVPSSVRVPVATVMRDHVRFATTVFEGPGSARLLVVSPDVPGSPETAPDALGSPDAPGSPEVPDEQPLALDDAEFEELLRAGLAAGGGVAEEDRDVEMSGTDAPALAPYWEGQELDWDVVHGAGADSSAELFGPAEELFGPAEELFGPADGLSYEEFLADELPVDEFLAGAEDLYEADGFEWDQWDMPGDPLAEPGRLGDEPADEPGVQGLAELLAGREWRGARTVETEVDGAGVVRVVKVDLTDGAGVVRGAFFPAWQEVVSGRAQKAAEWFRRFVPVGADFTVALHPFTDVWGSATGYAVTDVSSGAPVSVDVREQGVFALKDAADTMSLAAQGTRPLVLLAMCGAVQGEEPLLARLQSFADGPGGGERVAGVSGLLKLGPRGWRSQPRGPVLETRPDGGLTGSAVRLPEPPDDGTPFEDEDGVTLGDDRVAGGSGEGPSRPGGGAKRDAGAVGDAAGAGAHKRSRSDVPGDGTADPLNANAGVLRQVWRAEAKPGKTGPKAVAGDAALSREIDTLAARLIEYAQAGLAPPPVRAVFHAKVTSLTEGVHEAWRTFFEERIDLALTARGSGLRVAGLGVAVDLARRASADVAVSWVELLVGEGPGERIGRLRAASSVVLELEPKSTSGRVWSSSWGRLIRRVEGAGYEALAAFAAGNDPRLPDISAVIVRRNAATAEAKAQLKARVEDRVRWGLERVRAAARAGRPLPGGLSADRLPTVEQMMPDVQVKGKIAKKAKAGDAVDEVRVMVAVPRRAPDAGTAGWEQKLEELFAGLESLRLLDPPPPAGGAVEAGRPPGHLWEGDVEYVKARVAEAGMAGLLAAVEDIVTMVIDAWEKGREAPIVRALFHGTSHQKQRLDSGHWRTVLTDLVEKALTARLPGLTARVAGLVIDLMKAEGKADHAGLALEAEAGPAEPVASLRAAASVTLEMVPKTIMQIKGVSSGRVMWRSQGAGAEALEAFAAGHAEQARMPVLTVTVRRRDALTGEQREKLAGAIRDQVGRQVRLGAAQVLAAARMRAEKNPSWLQPDRLPLLKDFVPEVQVTFVTQGRSAAQAAAFEAVPGPAGGNLAKREQTVAAFFAAARAAGVTDAVLARATAKPAKPADTGADGWREVWQATASPTKAGAKSVEGNAELTAAIGALAEELIDRCLEGREPPPVSLVCHVSWRFRQSDEAWQEMVEEMLDAALVAKGHPELSVAGLGLWVELRRKLTGGGASQMGLEVGEGRRGLLADLRMAPSVPLLLVPGNLIRVSAFSWARLLRQGEGAAVEALAAFAAGGNARMAPVTVTVTLTRSERRTAARVAEVEAELRREVMEQLRWSAERVLAGAKARAERGDRWHGLSPDRLPSVEDMMPEVKVRSETATSGTRVRIRADIPAREPAVAGSGGTARGVVEGFFAGLGARDLVGGRRPGLPAGVKAGLQGAGPVGADQVAGELPGVFAADYREDRDPWLEGETLAQVRAYAVRWAARMKEFAVQGKEFPQTRLHIRQKGGTKADGERLFEAVEGILWEEAERELGEFRRALRGRAGLGGPEVTLADLGLGFTRSWGLDKRTSEFNFENGIEAAAFRIATLAASGYTIEELAALREMPLYTGVGAVGRSELTPFELFRVQRMAEGFADRLYRDGQHDRLLLESKRGAIAEGAAQRRWAAVHKVVEAQVRRAFAEFGKRVPSSERLPVAVVMRDYVRSAVVEFEGPGSARLRVVPDDAPGSPEVLDEQPLDQSGPGTSGGVEEPAEDGDAEMSGTDALASYGEGQDLDWDALNEGQLLDWDALGELPVQGEAGLAEGMPYQDFPADADDLYRADGFDFAVADGFDWDQWAGPDDPMLGMEEFGWYQTGLTPPRGEDAADAEAVADPPRFADQLPERGRQKGPGGPLGQPVSGAAPQAPPGGGLTMTELRDAGGGDYGMVFSTGAETGKSMARGAARATKYGRRVIAEYPLDGSDPRAGRVDRRVERVADWAPTTEDDRADQLHLFLEIGQNGLFGDYLTAGEMAKTVVATAMLRKAMRAEARPPLLVAPHRIGASSAADTAMRAFVAELKALTGPGQLRWHAGKSTVWEDYGVLGIEPGGTITEVPVALAEVEYVSSGRVFGFAGRYLDNSSLLRLADAVNSGRLSLQGLPGLPDGSDALVVILDGVPSHADLRSAGGPVIEQGGRSIGRMLLEDPRFVAAIKADPDRELVVLSPEGAKRVNIGGLGFDLASELRGAGHFLPMFAPTGGWRTDASGFVLEPGCSFVSVSGLRAGDLKISSQYGDSDEIMALHVRSPGDGRRVAEFGRWLAAATAESLETFVLPDGTRVDSPFKNQPAPGILVLWRGLDGAYQAQQLDDREVLGPLSALAPGLRSDPGIREMQGILPHTPLLVLTLGGETEGLAEFAKEMLPGGYSRPFYTVRELSLAKPGVLGGKEFVRVDPAGYGWRNVVTLPVVAADGSVRGQIHPSKPFDAAADSFVNQLFAAVEPRDYYVESDPGSTVARQKTIPVPWGCGAYQVDGHGAPGVFYLTLTTDDPYHTGDLVQDNGELLADAVFLGEAFRQASPRGEILFCQCFGGAAGPDGLSVAQVFIATAANKYQPVTVIAADERTYNYPSGRKGVHEPGAFREVVTGGKTIGGPSGLRQGQPVASSAAAAGRSSAKRPRVKSGSTLADAGSLVLPDAAGGFRGASFALPAAELVASDPASDNGVPGAQVAKLPEGFAVIVQGRTAAVLDQAAFAQLLHMTLLGGFAASLVLVTSHLWTSVADRRTAGFDALPPAPTIEELEDGPANLPGDGPESAPPGPGRGVPGTGETSDLLVDGIRISAVDRVPLGRPDGSFGMAFPLDDRERSVMEQYVPEPGDDRYAVLLHRARPGYRVKADGRVVALDEAAFTRLLVGIGVLSAAEGRAGLVLVTCPQWAWPGIGALESMVREAGFGYPVQLWGSGSRVELLPGGRARNMAEGNTPAHGGVVLGPKPRGIKKNRGKAKSESPGRGATPKLGGLDGLSLPLRGPKPTAGPSGEMEIDEIPDDRGEPMDVDADLAAGEHGASSGSGRVSAGLQATAMQLLEEKHSAGENLPTSTDLMTAVPGLSSYAAKKMITEFRKRNSMSRPTLVAVPAALRAAAWQVMKTECASGNRLPGKDRLCGMPGLTGLSRSMAGILIDEFLAANEDALPPAKNKTAVATDEQRQTVRQMFAEALFADKPLPGRQRVQDKTGLSEYAAVRLVKEIREEVAALPRGMATEDQRAKAWEMFEEAYAVGRPLPGWIRLQPVTNLSRRIADRLIAEFLAANPTAIAPNRSQGVTPQQRAAAWQMFTETPAGKPVPGERVLKAATGLPPVLANDLVAEFLAKNPLATPPSGEWRAVDDNQRAKARQIFVAACAAGEALPSWSRLQGEANVSRSVAQLLRWEFVVAAEVEQDATVRRPAREDRELAEPAVKRSGSPRIVTRPVLDKRLDDAFVFRSIANPRGAVEERYAGADGRLHPNVIAGARHIRWSELLVGKKLLKQIAKDPRDHRLPASILPHLDEFIAGLQKSVAAEVRRLIAPVDPGHVPWVEARPLTAQHVPEDSGRIGQNSTFLVTPPFPGQDAAKLPALRNGRILSLYFGAPLRTPKEVREWEKTYAQYPNYTITAPLRGGGKIQIAAEGGANAAGLADTAVRVNKKGKAIGSKLINSMFFPFAVRLPCADGIWRWDTVVALVAFDNAFDPVTNPLGLVIPDYGDEFDLTFTPRVDVQQEDEHGAESEQGSSDPV
ncbi:hypothetical protein [Amycolatopsis sp. NPDC000740]|uniref:hypothetical protein n=1 Tax=Amycolatopsis sp. NPDC000740 TaxID=3154269 RepID=UPI003321727F